MTDQTPIDIDDLVGNSITKSYTPDLAYNRIIVTRGSDVVAADLGETPYLEKYIALPDDNTSTLADYAVEYITNMREGWQKYSLSIRGITPRLFQLIDLTSIQRTLSITDAQHIYRISDISYDIGDTGGVSSMSLISKDYDIIDSNSLIGIGTLPLDASISATAQTTVNAAKGRIAEVSGIGTGTVTVTYDTGETEVLLDYA